LSLNTERQTHDYVRPGVTNLYAALTVASGKVIGALADRQRQTEYIQLRHVVDRQTPKEEVLHLIMDNVSSHKTNQVQEFLEEHPERFIVHFTPTHASWLNLVERWFSEITTKQIRRENWGCVKQLKRAIMEYIHHWNDSGRWFVWTKSAEHILPRVRKAREDEVRSRLQDTILEMVPRQQPLSALADKYQTRSLKAVGFLLVKRDLSGWLGKMNLSVDSNYVFWS